MSASEFKTWKLRLDESAGLLRNQTVTTISRCANSGGFIESLTLAIALSKTGMYANPHLKKWLSFKRCLQSGSPDISMNLLSTKDRFNRIEECN